MEAAPLSFKQFVTQFRSFRQDGLVFLGAGGNLQDWISGIPKELFKEHISASENPEDIFSNAYVMTANDGRVDLALTFKQDSKIDMNKLSLWRIRFGDCSWISDFIVNYKEHYK